MARQLFEDGEGVSEALHGLIVRQPWADMIAEGKKTWEIRGRSTRVRGWIAIIAAGTGQIVGGGMLAGVIGPLSLDRYQTAADLHCTPPERLDHLPYERTFAWCLSDGMAVAPIRYEHPIGAVTWVRLMPGTREAFVARARAKMASSE